MKHLFNTVNSIVLMMFISIVFSGCQLKTELSLAGRTMGTTYHIKLVSWFYQDQEKLQAKIDHRLKEINRSMSIFDKTSEISRFNVFDKTNEPFHISNDFAKVMVNAKELYDLSGGAWDATVYPLINLWGFGNTGIRKSVPPANEIHRMMSIIGFDKIEIQNQSYLVKKIPEIGLNLASVAKGFAVDQISLLLIELGIKNFLVEIGGEVYASGTKKDGQKWIVGINTPEKFASLTEVFKKVVLIDKAMATSGDYRNFFEVNGQRYSHIIDPRTGYPVSNHVISVSIIAPTCTIADGLATAIMVMGPKNGLALVRTLTEVECLIIEKKMNGEYLEYASEAFF